MLEELNKYINKSITIFLQSGKQKKGKIVFIDTDDNTISFEDNSSLAISFIKRIENGDNGNIIVNDPIVERKATQAVVLPKEEAKIDTKVFEKLARIEATFDTEIRNVSTEIEKPNFQKLPQEIIDKNGGVSNSDDCKLWATIKNKYENALKTGTLNANSDNLGAVIVKCEELITQNSKLGTAYELLGYFQHINNSPKSVTNYQSACKILSTNNYWLNLANISSKFEQKESTLFALESLFSQVNLIDNQYEKAWYKLIDLINQFSAYSILAFFLNDKTRNLSEEETQKIFDGICYALIKKDKKEHVEKLIEHSLKENADIIRMLSFAGLKVLPEKSADSYILFKLDWKEQKTKRVETQVVIPKIEKPSFYTSQPTYLAKKAPKGSNAETLKNARIERDITKNLVKAEGLFIKGIENEHNSEIKQRAVRDLASMLGQQMKEPKRGIEVIRKYQPMLSDSDLHLLYSLHFQAGEYEDAIRIQKQILQNTPRRDLKLARYFGLAVCYIELGNFKEAESCYRQALKINPSQYQIERNIALCLYRQGNEAEAKRILNRIIGDYGDANSQKLLDTIEGKNQNTDFVFDTYGENLDNFANFYLSACDFKYVEKSRIEDGKYIGSDDNKRSDIDKLVRTASTLKTRIAEERSNIYLNAARIYYDLGELDNDFYKYLCRSFASKGDSAVQSNNTIDAVRTYYLTALKIYDALYFDEEQNQKQDEQDAVNALCRFLYSYLGRDKIPVLVVDGKSLNIKESLNTILSNLVDKNKIFSALGFIFSCSPQYSMNRVLKILFENMDSRKQSCAFLKIENNAPYEIFVEFWKRQAKDIKKKENELSSQLSPLRNFQIAEMWLLSSIDRLKNLTNKVLFDLDKDYLQDLHNLFDYCISLSKASDFDEKNNKIEDIRLRAENLLREIQKNPTKISIEEIFPILNNLLAVVEKYVKDLFANAKPELKFSSVFPAYQLKNNTQIDLQVKIENTADGHAEQVELALEANPIYFKAHTNILVSYNTIKGNSNDSKIIELELTEKAIEEKAFSIQIKAAFNNRLNEIFTTPTTSLAVQLGEQSDFVEIQPNPYANGASGKPVTTDEMFYGRTTYIESAYKTMIEDGISYVIYGQFRSGKSSVLAHLEKKLENNPQIIVARLGDIGRFMGESPTPMYYRFLHRILSSLRDAILKKIKEIKLSLIDFAVPDSKTFYEHPSPADYFYELMDNFQSKKAELADWQNVRMIVSIDEFTYIYGQIVEGKLSQDFMKSWKALLAMNYFNVVLVAQDVFPKFYAQFENAFGTIFLKRITYLDEQSARELIDEPIKRLNKGESKFRENAVDKIIELTAGHPWYIQIFCNVLIDYINTDKQPYITGANIDKVKERLLRGTERKDNFKNFIENGDPAKDRIPERDIVLVLKKIAEHTKNSEYCSPSSINCTTDFELNEVLKDLESREVIATHGEKGYKIRVGLFKEWLNENPNIWE